MRYYRNQLKSTCIVNFLFFATLFMLFLYQQNCVSGPKDCSCSFIGECDMNHSNLVDVQHSVHDEDSCRELCEVFEFSKCHFFTYFDSTSDFPRLCFLFNSCKEKNDCAGCSHGPRECDFCSVEDTNSGKCHHFGKDIKIFGQLIIII